MSDEIRELVNERSEVHGNYTAHAHASQSLKNIIRLNWIGDTPTPVMQETLEMIAHKLARIIVGDAYHADHWRDIAGYSFLCCADIEDGDTSSVQEKAPVKAESQDAG